MEYEEIRPFVLESLKTRRDTQVINLLNSVEDTMVRRGLYAGHAKYQFGGMVTEHQMPQEDREKVREIIGDLVLEGILCWGINEHNPAPPFLKVTRHGQEIIEKGQPQPYDPDGYLKYVRTEIPKLDDTIFMYVSESLNAYLRGLMLSSTVMIGVASEKAILILIDALQNSISDPTRKQEFERKTSVMSIKTKFGHLQNEIMDLKKKKVLPSDIADDLEIQLDSIFNLIRICRNDAGHPTGKEIDRRVAYANLQIFVPYCTRIYDLINFFNANKVP